MSRLRRGVLGGGGCAFTVGSCDLARVYTITGMKRDAPPCLSNIVTPSAVLAGLWHVGSPPTGPRAMNGV